MAEETDVTFEIGDVVEHITGTPPVMTIIETPRDVIRCRRFEGNCARNIIDYDFSPNLLRKLDFVPKIDDLNRKIEPRDVVQLKSGGPVMGVEDVKGNNVKCQWYDLNCRPKYQNYDFHMETLMLTDKPANKPE